MRRKERAADNDHHSDVAAGAPVAAGRVTRTARLEASGAAANRPPVLTARAPASRGADDEAFGLHVDVDERSFEKEGGKSSFVVIHADGGVTKALWNFEVGDASPRSEHLDELASLLKHYGDELGVVTIDGHTSASGSDAANTDLAARRADEVRRALVALGARVPLVMRSHGESQPWVAETDAQSMALNRRVVVSMRRKPKPEPSPAAEPAPNPGVRPKPPSLISCGYFEWMEKYYRALAAAWALSMANGFRDEGGGNVAKPSAGHWNMAFGRVYPDISDATKAWQDYSGVLLPDAMGASNKARVEADEFKRLAEKEHLCDPDKRYTPPDPIGNDDPDDPGGLTRPAPFAV